MNRKVFVRPLLDGLSGVIGRSRTQHHRKIVRSASIKASKSNASIASAKSLASGLIHRAIDTQTRLNSSALASNSSSRSAFQHRVLHPHTGVGSVRAFSTQSPHPADTIYDLHANATLGIDSIPHENEDSVARRLPLWKFSQLLRHLLEKHSNFRLFMLSHDVVGDDIRSMVELEAGAMASASHREETRNEFVHTHRMTEDAAEWLYWDRCPSTHLILAAFNTNPTARMVDIVEEFLSQPCNQLWKKHFTAESRDQALHLTVLVYHLRRSFTCVSRGPEYTLSHCVPSAPQTECEAMLKEVRWVQKEYEGIHRLVQLYKDIDSTSSQSIPASDSQAAKLNKLQNQLRRVAKSAFKAQLDSNLADCLAWMLSKNQFVSYLFHHPDTRDLMKRGMKNDKLKRWAHVDEDALEPVPFVEEAVEWCFGSESGLHAMDGVAVTAGFLQTPAAATMRELIVADRGLLWRCIYRFIRGQSNLQDSPRAPPHYFAKLKDQWARAHVKLALDDSADPDEADTAQIDKQKKRTSIRTLRLRMEIR